MLDEVGGGLKLSGWLGEKGVDHGTPTSGFRGWSGVLSKVGEDGNKTAFCDSQPCALNGPEEIAAAEDLRVRRLPPCGRGGGTGEEFLERSNLVEGWLTIRSTSFSRHLGQREMILRGVGG